MNSGVIPATVTREEKICLRYALVYSFSGVSDLNDASSCIIAVSLKLNVSFPRNLNVYFTTFISYFIY